MILCGLFKCNVVFQLFHVKRAFITLVKEENVLEMFDPQEPHSITMQQDEGICHETIKSREGVFAIPDMGADERYANAVRCLFRLSIPQKSLLRNHSLRRSPAYPKTSLRRRLDIDRMCYDLFALLTYHQLTIACHSFMQASRESHDTVL